MARTVYHVTHKDGQWHVLLEGTSTPISSYDTKDKAFAAAHQRAESNKPSQIKIHKMDGTFEEERTYGDDPFPPRG
jgi:hypothetical protein